MAQPVFERRELAALKTPCNLSRNFSSQQTLTNKNEINAARLGLKMQSNCPFLYGSTGNKAPKEAFFIASCRK